MSVSITFWVFMSFLKKKKEKLILENSNNININQQYYHLFRLANNRRQVSDCSLWLVSTWDRPDSRSAPDRCSRPTRSVWSPTRRQTISSRTARERPLCRQRWRRPTSTRFQLSRRRRRRDCLWLDCGRRIEHRARRVWPRRLSEKEEFVSFFF
mgnify:CR=1 FL=1